jgi:pimeloyl-ACP methyl ester carboxylesterase
MKTLMRDDVALAYSESCRAHSQRLPLVFVHGWSYDHTLFAPQVARFSAAYRVITIDLRGHGDSDAPHQEYTVAGFADDLAWMCGQLGVERPVVIGHSMGGTIALELAACYPRLPAAIMLIDSVILPSPAFVEALRPIGEQLRRPSYCKAIEQAGETLFLPTDDANRKAQILTQMSLTPQHVAVSAFNNHLLAHDASAAAASCAVPAAYISAATTMADLPRFRALCPQLITGQTIGSGHFSPLEVPDQINAMIERFLMISVPERAYGTSAYAVSQ